MLTKKRKESFNAGVTNTQRGQERDFKGYECLLDITVYRSLVTLAGTHLLKEWGIAEGREASRNKS